MTSATCFRLNRSIIGPYTKANNMHSHKQRYST